MKSSLLQKLAQMAERRAEIERELASQAVAGNPDLFKRLSQEYAQLMGREVSEDIMKEASEWGYPET